jgi:hypothetical protein
MSWFKATSVTIANGGTVVSVNTGDDLSIAQESGGLVIGQNPPVEIKRTYLDGSGNKKIELISPWGFSTQTAQPAVAFPTDGDLAAATAVLRGLIDGLTTASQVVAESGTDNIQVMTPLRVKQSIQSEVGGGPSDLVNNTGLDEKILQSETDGFGSVRFSKIDNPLLHLFKKNNMMVTPNVNLLATRESGATYIDRNGMLKYSPSPYATNLIKRSEDLSDAIWGKAGGPSIVTGVVKNHRGVVLSEVSDSDVGVVSYIAQDVSVTAGSTYTFSVYTVQGSSPQFKAGILYTGKAVFVTGDSLGIREFDTLATSRRVERFGDEVVRISFSFVIPAGITSVSVRGYGSSGNSASDVGSNFYGGFQLEKAPTANGYVKTVDTTPLAGYSTKGITQLREGPDGWVVEQASTNILLQSQKMQTTPWETGGGANHATLISSTGIAPDGSYTAELYEDSDTVSRYVRMTFQLADPDLDKTASFFIKADTSSVVGLRMAYSGGSAKFRALSFNTVTKQFSEASGDLTDLSWGYTELANGWFRLWMTVLGGYDNTSFDFRVYPCDTGNANAVGRAYIWGCQLESTSDQTSYIPTTTVGVTRASMYVEITEIEDYIIPDGPFSVSVRTKIPVTGRHSPWSFGSTGLALWRYNRDGSIAVQGVVPQLQTSGSQPTEYADYLVIRDANDAVFLYINGEVVITSDRSLSNKIVGPLKIGRVANSGQNEAPLNASVLDFRIYDFALNKSEAKFLSGG